LCHGQVNIGISRYRLSEVVLLAGDCFVVKFEGIVFAAEGRRGIPWQPFVDGLIAGSKMWLGSSAADPERSPRNRLRAAFARC